MGNADFLNVGAIGEESFKYGLAVLIRSIAANCMIAREIRFFVLDVNLTDATRRKLKDTVSSFGGKSSIEYLALQDSHLLADLNVIFERRIRNFKERCWFAKFALPDLLSDRVEHFFYVDTDVYCGLDLSIAQVMQGNSPLSAVPDGPTNELGFSQEFADSNLDPKASYFNAGFMGFNLDYWRENNLSEKASAIAEEFGTFLIDQGLFNVLYYKKWMKLPLEWNHQSPFRWGGFEDLDSGKRITNLHYITNPKPWQVPYHHSTAFFFKALDQTAFRGWRPNALYWNLHFKARTAKYHLHNLRTSVGALGQRWLRK